MPENQKGKGKKKTKVKLELTRRDVLTMAGTTAGAVVFATAVTTGPLTPFANLNRVSWKAPRARAKARLGVSTGAC